MGSQTQMSNGRGLAASVLVTVAAAIVVTNAGWTDRTVYWLLISCSVPVNLFPLFYAFRPWRSTPQGRALMIKAVGNLLLIDVILASMIWPVWTGQRLLSNIGFGAFVGGIWYLFVAMLRSPGSGNYPPVSWLRWWRRRDDRALADEPAAG